ncbi:MAG: hypothetical protein ACRDWY_04050 [Actinomycetes bacterium]
MHRCRTALTVLLVGLFSVLAATPAAAGGPTSALLVAPDTGATASLHTSDADYQTLAGLVGAFEASGLSGTVDKSGRGHEAGAGVTVTWLIHDVQVWRVDRVYLDAEGGPWIATQTTLDESGTIWDTPAVWHTATDGKLLASLLDRLGVGESATGTARGPVTGTERGSATNTAPASETAAADADTTPRPVWGLAGLVLGVALTVAAVRLASVRSSAAARTPVPDPLPDPDGDLEWTLTDELSSPALPR